MKTQPLMFAAFLAVTVGTRSEEIISSEPGAPISTARILGLIPDGTPPPPAAPKPEFIVPAADILATATHEQGGRTITIRRIKPIALPPQPVPAATASTEELAAFSEDLTEYNAAHPKSGLLFLGATVFRAKDSPPRSIVSYWPEGKGEAVTFWSSADFALISAIPSFADAAADTHSLIMAWGYEDLESLSELKTAQDNYGVPSPPEFPEGQATFQIIGQAPAPEDLVPIQALHELYNKEYARLKTACEGRERARLAREAELQANPPKPKDIVLNYWRTEKPAAAKGGAK